MTAATNGPQDGRQAQRKARTLTMASVRSLETLVAAHPDAMRDIYQSGTVLDPTELGHARGRLLSVESFAGAFMLTQPLVKLASRLDPWRGKRFEPGGTAGKDMLFNLQAFRFRCALAESALDGRDTLRLSYDKLGNPWPVRNTFAELRRVGDTTAMGPAWFGDRLWLWWGLEVPHAG